MANGGILTRSTGLAAILLVITSIFLPMRPLAMELKIVGNQIILSGPVVGDEPGKIREALAFCLDTHTRDLLRKGQSVEKLALVQAW